MPLDQDGIVCCEDVLRAWLVAHLDAQDRLGLREVFGPVEDLERFANKVPYHVREISQLLRYSRWVAGRLASGETEAIQPVLIAHQFPQKAVIKA